MPLIFIIKATIFEPGYDVLLCIIKIENKDVPCRGSAQGIIIYKYIQLLCVGQKTWRKIMH